MNDPEKLREISWRRPLTDAERVALRESSAENANKVELDLALTRELSRLPNAPLSSNFTSRVLAAVEREEVSRARARLPRWTWRVLVPRIAFAASGVLTVAAIFTLVSHNQQAQARHLAQSVAAVSGVEALPGPEILQNFEAIRQLGTTPEPDEKLLALFK